MSGIRFGLLGHPYNAEHLYRVMKFHQPGLRRLSREFLKKLYEWTQPYSDVFIKFKSQTGKTITGNYIMVPILPDFIAKPRIIVEKTMRTFQLAEQMGVDLVTLGGYTSLVGERYHQEIKNRTRLPVTTGNIYTAALTVEGIRKIVKAIPLSMEDCHVLVIGLSDVAVGCAKALATGCKKMTVASRNLKKWPTIIEDIEKTCGKGCVAFVPDMEKSAREADIVIVSVNVLDNSFDPFLFKKGAVLCDVGYPKNISHYFAKYPQKRPDLMVFCGAYASMPDQIDCGYNLGLPSLNVTYGCFGEALILALEDRCEAYSTGRGNVTVDKMDEIMAMGRKHGLDVAPFYLDKQEITEQALDQFRSYVQSK